jgi:hypothetical protein
MATEQFSVEQVVSQIQWIADSVREGKLTLLVPSVSGDCDVRDLPVEGRLLDCPIGS